MIRAQEQAVVCNKLSNGQLREGILFGLQQSHTIMDRLHQGQKLDDE